MNVNSLYDIVMLYQYKTMMQSEDYEFVIPLIDFNNFKGEANEQFEILELDENHIKFVDHIRRKVFEMIKGKIHSCGQYVYEIKMLED